MIQYNGQHSIDFFSDLSDAGTLSTKNTWRDWRIVPSKKPYVTPPSLKTNIVQIPGSNRLLDLSEYLTGGPTFEARTGEWEFIVDLDYWGDSELVYSYFLANLHAKKLYCELQDNPGIIYTGRFSVTDFESSDTYPVLKIGYTISPTFRRRISINSSGEYVYTISTLQQAVNVESELSSISSSDYLL